MDWSRCDDIEYDNQYENSMFHTGTVEIILNLSIFFSENIKNMWKTSSVFEA
jgi:hypothetical protein